MYLKSFIIASLIVGFSWSFSLRAQNNFKKTNQMLYQMEDLTALAKLGQTQEFFEHIKDIPPRERGAEYNELILKMANVHIKDLLVQNKITSQTVSQAQKHLDHIFVEQDEFYMTSYKKLLVKYLKRCFEINSYQTCEKELVSFWNKDQTSAFGIQLAKILTPYLNEELKNLNSGSSFTGSDPLLLETLLKPALGNPMAEFYCKEKDFQGIAYNIYLKLKKHSQKEILKVFHPDCIKSLQSVLLTWMYQTPLSQKSALLSLVEDQDLKKDLNSYIAILNLFDIKTDKAELNKAWLVLEQLSRNYQTRVKILKLIKEDPNITLPIIQNMNNYLTKLRIKHIAKKFPELFKELTDNCSSPKIYDYCSEISKVNQTLKLL